MIDSKIIIFGYPRSGTKLLANVLEQQGYFNFREFFDTYSSEIDSAFPVAKRISAKKQVEIFNQYNNNIQEKLYVHSTEIKARIQKFNDCVGNYQRSTLTVHSTTFDIAPELFEVFRDHHFLCTRRKNKFEQLVSRILTARFKNYDGEHQSEKMDFDLELFEKFYLHLRKTEEVQDFLISRGRGTLVDFDQLISGSLNLGFDYQVNSVDQHSNPESLIKNYYEVLAKFDQLNFKYPM